MYNICCFRHNQASSDIKNLLAKNNIKLFDYKIAKIIYNFAIDFNYLRNFSKIILTSRNSIRTDDLANWYQLNLQKDFIVIGNNFARYLQENNIKNIQVFNSIRNIKNVINNKDEYLYVRGNNTSYDLRFHHPNIQEIIYYKIKFDNLHKDKILSFLTKNKIDKKIGRAHV